MERKIANRLKVFYATDGIRSGVDIWKTFVNVDHIINRQATEFVAAHLLILRQHWPEVRGSVENHAARLMHPVRFQVGKAPS
jgi:hypothetical protein